MAYQVRIKIGIERERKAHEIVGIGLEKTEKKRTSVGYLERV